MTEDVQLLRQIETHSKRTADLLERLVAVLEGAEMPELVEIPPTAGQKMERNHQRFVDKIRARR